MSLPMKWLHLLGIIISLGTALTYVCAIIPTINKLESREKRVVFIADVIKYIHPLFLFGICLIFMTGAIGLTDLKISLGTGFYEQIGRVLMWKFGFTMLIFLIAGMQFFGQGLKLQRMIVGTIPGDLERQEYYAKKIQRAMTMNLVFLAITLYIGLKLPIAIAGS